MKNACSWTWTRINRSIRHGGRKHWWWKRSRWSDGSGPGGQHTSLHTPAASFMERSLEGTSDGRKKTSSGVEALISWKKQGLGSRQVVTSEQAPELVAAHLITNETSILRRHCWEADIWPAHSTMHSIWIKYCWLDTNFQIKGHS